MALAVDTGGCRDQWEVGGSLCVQELLAQGLKGIPRRRLLEACLVMEGVHSPLSMGKRTGGGPSPVQHSLGPWEGWRAPNPDRRIPNHSSPLNLSSRQTVGEGMRHNPTLWVTCNAIWVRLLHASNRASKWWRNNEPVCEDPKIRASNIIP